MEEGAPDALDEIAPPEPDEDWSASALGQTLQQGRSIVAVGTDLFSSRSECIP